MRYARAQEYYKARGPFLDNQREIVHIRYANGGSKMTRLRALERKRPADDQTDWVTAFFMPSFTLALLRRCFSLRGKPS
jgi:hypothetical protein